MLKLTGTIMIADVIVLYTTNMYRQRRLRLLVPLVSASSSCMIIMVL